MTGHSGRIVGYTEAIHFNGLPPARGCVTDPRFRCATPARRPFYVKLGCRDVTGRRPSPEEHIPSGLDRVRVRLLASSIGIAGN